MSKVVRTNRVQVMMNEPELSEVDGFRFSHQIATRSEAIRCLAVIGLRAVSEAGHVEKIIHRSTRKGKVE